MILEFPKTKVDNISFIPRLFTKMFENYKKHQDDIKRRKLDFLHGQAFQYFLDLEEADLCRQIQDKGVNLPPFMLIEQARKRAYDKASIALLEVIKDCRVDECYSKRIKQLKGGK